MVMELGSTRWTDTNPTPFGPAPGGGTGGLASTRWTSTVPTPFGPAPGGGSFGGVYDSGFAAEPVKNVTFEDDIIINADWKIHVTEKPIAAGKVPSMVLQFFITDRGLADKKTFDTLIHKFLQDGGYKVSLQTSFKSESVAWQWKKEEEVPGFAFYYPVVASPAKWAGLRYSGNALDVTAIHAPTDAMLQRLPNHVYLYTMALTSANNSMSDGDSAQALTLVKQGLINMNRDLRINVSTQIAATITGCPESVFKKPVKPVVKGVISSLILVAAWEMLATQFGSERL
jgi:hypothetical protein